MEAFLIGRLCGGQAAETYKNKAFVKDIDGKFMIQGDSNISEELTVEKKENGNVILKAYGGV